MILTITQSVEANILVLTVTFQDYSPLPSPNVFLYKNTGTNVMGEYFAVASLAQLNRFQVWNNKPIPLFANAYYLNNYAKISVSQQEELTEQLQALENEFINSKPISTTIII